MEECKKVGQFFTSTDDGACGNQINKNPEKFKAQLRALTDRIEEEGEKENQEEKLGKSL